MCDIDKKNEDDDDVIVAVPQQAIKFLDGNNKNDNNDLIKKKNLYRSFIAIIFSAFCLTISLGVNEMFKLILDHTKSEKSNINEIGYYVIYIFGLIILTLSLVYFCNVQVS